MNQKRKLIRFGKAVLFFLLLIPVLFLLDQTFLMKNPDGVMPMRNYYQQPQGQVDAVILGTSRAGINLDCAELWRAHGISAYALWGSMQPFWNTYYFLKEAIRVNPPRSVVLDVHASTYDFEFSDEQRQYTNTGGLLFGTNKIESVKVTAPKEEWMKLILGLPVYHSRFDELGEADFMCLWNGEGEINKGTTVRYGQGSLADYGLVSGTEGTAVLEEKEEKYLNMIIGMCRDEQIPIVLIATPSENRSQKAPYLNRIQEIADSFGVPFINFDLLDEQIGFTPACFYLDNLHLNTEGGRRISDYLGQWLRDNFNLPDHRGDESYSSWEKFAQKEENDYIGMITVLDAYLAEIERDGKSVFWAYNGFDTDPVFEHFAEYVSAGETGETVRETIYGPDGDGRVMKIFAGNAGEYFHDMEKSDALLDVGIGKNQLTLSLDEEEEQVSVNLDESVMNKGIFSFVYDEGTDEIVDVGILYGIDDGKIGEPGFLSGITVKHL